MWREILNPDVLLYVLLLGFTLFGWWFGVIHAVGALIGTIAGAFAAAHYNDQIAAWLVDSFSVPGAMAHVLMFFTVFFVVDRLVGLVFWVIDRSIDFARFVPFIKSLNRFLGACFGFVEGTMVLGLGLAYLTVLPYGQGMREYFTDSSVAPWLIDSARVLYPLLPEAWEKVRHVLETSA